MITSSDRITSIHNLNDRLLSLCSKFLDEGVPELSMDRVEVIDKLDNALSIVQQTFRLVVDLLQHHRNSLHPVSTIPFDVLAHIFKYNDIHSAIKASYVCRWWREVVITSPSLWTLASIRTGEYEYCSESTQATTAHESKQWNCAF
ncbi:hypothetical protein FS842_011041 [Serendipita sp. 407]|nr:hypothetical protein FS842_011041 [Serendipita sp. 407]